jgi:ferritin-like metal-binding protein YciE
MSLKDVLIDELRDLYSAENQLVKALPKLAKGAKDPKLKQVFTAHLDQTKEQVARLQDIFALLEEKPTGQHCGGMEGIIEEGKEALEKDEQGASFDVGIVGAALRTEHYEIAGYQAAIAMAQALGLEDIVQTLSISLDEETSAATKVNAAAKPILARSAAEPEEAKKSKSGKEKYSAKKSVEDEKRAAPDIKRHKAS